MKKSILCLITLSSLLSIMISINKLVSQLYPPPSKIIYSNPAPINYFKALGAGDKFTEFAKLFCGEIERCAEGDRISMFDFALLLTLSVEVDRRSVHRVINDPNDSGGVTKYGISANFISEKIPNSEDFVKTMLPLEARLIYYNEFWKPISFINENQYLGISSALQIMLFAYGVNIGSTTAIKQLQGLVGAVQDGVMGIETEAKIKAYIRRYGLYDTLLSFREMQEAYRKKLKDYPIFGKGWDNRDDNIFKGVRIVFRLGEYAPSPEYVLNSITPPAEICRG